MIQFENVTKSYGSKKVLKNINLTIEDGEFAVMIGPSGCGKTTTLKSINRLIEPDQGNILVDGKDISKVDRIELRRSIGYVIQQIGLFPNMTVEQNICVVPKLLKYSKERCAEIAHQMLELVGMPFEEYAHKYPSQLSGGQQQRIGVLRALAASPPIVLMDEPFGALDPMTRAVLQEEVRHLQQQLGKTIVFVTHDMDEALILADKIVFMNEGEILQIASPKEMLEHPAHELISNFMGRRASEMDAIPQTAEDIMRGGIFTSGLETSVIEALEKMARRKVDSLIVKQADGTYAGTVTVKDMKNAGKTIRTIEALVRTTNDWVYIDEDAQVCYEKLLNGDDNYLVVLSRTQKPVGIVTKTSLAKALAEAVWREGNDEIS